MYKKILCFLFILITFCNVILISQDHDYPWEKVYDIPIGTADGELGKESKEIPGILPLLPGPLIISEDSFILFDLVNKRINTYDHSFSYKNKIQLNDGNMKLDTRYIYDAKLDKENNIFFIYSDFKKELCMIDIPNNKLKKIEVLENSQVFDKYNYFPLKDKIVYYANNDVQFAFYEDNPSLRNIQKEYTINLAQEEHLIINQLQKPQELIDHIVKNKLFLDGNRLLSTNIEDYMKYQSYIQNEFQNLKNTRDPFNYKPKKFLGFDNDDNLYWKVLIIHEGRKPQMKILVFNKYGFITANINIEMHSVPVIAPLGNIYKMEINDSVVTVYKITRHW